jgi:ADP-ribosylglycohydrolase
MVRSSVGNRYVGVAERETTTRAENALVRTILQQGKRLSLITHRGKAATATAIITTATIVSPLQKEESRENIKPSFVKL